VRINIYPYVKNEPKGQNQTFFQLFQTGQNVQEWLGVVRSLPSEERACSGSLPLGGIVSAMLVLGGMLSFPPLGARLTLFQAGERAHLSGAAGTKSDP
jgi:hypothetical protein